MPNLDSLFENFLETAASIAVLFFIISWIASKVVEIGQSIFNAHGKRLHIELARLFGEEKDPEKRFTTKFYNHPLVEPLCQQSADSALGRWREWLAKRREGADEGTSWTSAIVRRLPPIRRPAKRLPAYIAPDTFAAVMSDPLYFSESGDRPSPGESPSIRDLIAGWSRDDTGAIGKPMLRHLQGSDGDIDEFRNAVARWYSEAMDRATGRFKRSTVRWLIAAAFVFCFFFNINFVTILSALLTNSELRATGFQTSEYFRDRPDEMRALGARLLFNARYEGTNGCRRRPPGMSESECHRRLLEALWREPQRPNMAGLLSFGPPANRPPSQPPAEAVKLQQISRIRDYCDAESRIVPAGTSQQRVDFCPQPLVTRLYQCLGETDPYTALATRLRQPQPPDGSAEAGTNTTAPAIPAAAPPGQASGCPPTTWASIWTTPTFFWDGQAAAELAQYLLDEPSLPPADRPRREQLLRQQLDRTRDEATADANRIGGFFSSLPGVGYFWDQLDRNPATWPYALAGAFLSALLAGFGAPFWFDLLSKVSRRGARGQSPSGG